MGPTLAVKFGYSHGVVHTLLCLRPGCVCPRWVLLLTCLFKHLHSVVLFLIRKNFSVTADLSCACLS